MKKILILAVAILICSFLKAQDSIYDISVMDVQEPIEVPVSEMEYYVIVDEPATFQGGDIKAFADWVNAHVVYSTEMGIFGRSYVQFIVDTTGSIEKIQIVRSLDQVYDKEVLRVISESPKWEPAKIRGKLVKQQITIPVTFTPKK